MAEPPDPPRGETLAPPALLEKMRTRGRTIVIAEDDSEELGLLRSMNANANVGGADLTHIILRADARLIEAWEGYLHGVQQSCGVIEALGYDAAEVHVKRFMIRRRIALGLAEKNVAVLRRMLGDF